MLSLIAMAVSGCGSVQSPSLAPSTSHSESSRWNWEIDGAAKKLAWYQESVAVAIPANIANAVLTPATIEEIERADKILQKQFGSRWEPFSHVFHAGDTAWHWTDKSGMGGYLVKTGDKIRAWRFVHYGPP